MVKLLVIITFSSFVINAPAQGLFDTSTATTNRIDLNGYTRGTIWGLGEEYDYTSAFGEFCLQSSFSTQNVAMFADVRFRSGIFFNEPATIFELKEAYASYRPGSFSFTLGQQIVNWGSTDGFNPTNNITPYNYFFLTANPDDQRIANFLLRSSWQISKKISWESIVIPVYKPSVYRYELFNLGINTTFGKAQKPDINFKNGTFATLLTFELKGISFSTSWFNGYDPFYGFGIDNIEWTAMGPKVNYKASFYRKNTAGFDIEIPLKHLIFRSEVAANFIDEDKEQNYLPSDGISAVGAIEIPKGDFLLLMQYIGSFTFNFTVLNKPVGDENLPQPLQMHYAEELIRYETAQFNRQIFHQQEKWNHALSLTARQMLTYQTLELEATGYYNITSEEWMLRPSISWKASHAIDLTIGAQLMNGEKSTVFYHASKIMNGVFVELKTIF